VPLTEDERRGAVRRALLVHAAGGDPHRDPRLADPAVRSLARDLDRPERRAALIGALPEPFRHDPQRAWQAWAAALLAEAIADES
jgi:hypothetical protein